MPSRKTIPLPRRGKRLIACHLQEKGGGLLVRTYPGPPPFRIGLGKRVFALVDTDPDGEKATYQEVEAE